MPAATTTPDYSQQLHDAIQSTRNAILSQRSTADANSVTNLGALDVSRRTFADARLALADAQAGLIVASYLDRKLVDANLTSVNNVTLATSSNTRAVATTGAVATAAASIRTAADSIDAVTRDVNGVAGITKSNDVNEPVDVAAKAAVDAVAKVSRAVEILKSLALQANVEAARPRTAAALQAAQASQKSVAAILGSADTAVAAGTDAVTKAQASRTADLNDLFQKSAQFTIAAQDDAALGTAITVVDTVSNASLKVIVNNAPEQKGGAEVAGLQATAYFSAAVLEDTRDLRFFAVPQEDLLSFDFEHALKHSHYTKFPLTDISKLPKKNGLLECTVILRKDSNDHVLKYGDTYSIFFLRVPKTEKTRATDFSFPTPPITSTVVLTFPSKPVLFALPNGALVAGFEGTDHFDKVGSYEFFFAPTEIYNTTPGAELLLADRLNAASVTTLQKSQACTHPATVAAAIKREYHREMRAFGPVPSEPIDAALKPFDKWVHEKHPTGFYVIYLSPFANKAGWQKDATYYIGRYSDMYGDLLDLERRTYFGLVLATGYINDKQILEAANVISEPSHSFPVQLTLDQPVDDASRKPAKK